MGTYSVLIILLFLLRDYWEFMNSGFGIGSCLGTRTFREGGVMIHWLGLLGRVWALAIMPLHYSVLSMVVSWFCTLIHYILRFNCPH